MLISTGTIARENHILISVRFNAFNDPIIKFVMWNHMVEIALPRFLRRGEYDFP